MRARRPAGIVFGSVIMKKRKTSSSGDDTSTHQKYAPPIGPRCHRAVIAWPLADRIAMPAANVSQKPTAIASSRSRVRIRKPPATMIAKALAIHGDIGAHQKSSGSARFLPRIRKQSTSATFDGLKTWRPPRRTRCLESRPIAAVPTKIHQPRRLHQSPCCVPGTRRTNATPLPVRSALAGHMITRRRQNAIADSSTAHVPSDSRICAIESRKSNATCPSTCSDTITEARCSRGSRSVGSRTGYDVPRMLRVGLPASTRAGTVMADSW
jgi:hypothetical protein